MLRQYRQALAEFVGLRVRLASASSETLQSFCAGERGKVQLFALQCRQEIATRRRQDICEVAASLSQRTRRYYYLELNCHLQSKLLHVSLPKVRYVVFG